MRAFAFALLALLFFFVELGVATSNENITYFSCTIEEPTDRGTNLLVKVKFAVINLDSFNEDTRLVPYPGVEPEEGLIYVSPTVHKKSGDYTMMSNLNSQGGDLRVEGSSLRLFGDGDGYQFTDLVVWDIISDKDDLEGYVRDYGPAYGGAESFKQFITCQRADKKL